MSIRPTLSALITFGVVFLFAATPAEAQLGKLKKAAQRGAENEAARQVEDMAASAVACAFDDFECIEGAEEAGGTVVYTDSEGRVVVDDDGKPITDREKARKRAGEPPEDEAGDVEPGEIEAVPVKPGEGVWANYDFIRGDRILFAEDFEDDRVGNFPKRLEFVRGNIEVVEWEGRRLVRVTSSSAFNIHLPETLPERFTIEFELNNGAAHMGQRLYTSVPEANRGKYEGNWFAFNSSPGVIGNGPKSTTQTFRIRDQLTAIRIQVDGGYAKVYLDEQRVANIPNAVFPRSDVIYIELTGNERLHSYFGNVVIAAGGMELYDALVEEGRVATQGIYFDLDSDVIQPQSTPTLDEIGRMLEKHEDIRIAIEGHTDAQGSDEYNLELSDRRAAAVVAFLVAEYDIDAGRLESAGLGETNPVADNETKEGRAQNRRVELVLLD